MGARGAPQRSPRDPRGAAGSAGEAARRARGAFLEAKRLLHFSAAAGSGSLAARRLGPEGFRSVPVTPRVAEDGGAVSGCITLLYMGPGVSNSRKLVDVS